MVDAVYSSDVPKPSRRIGLSRSDVLVGVLLALILLAGGYFRFVGQNWDDFVHWHPDERFLTGVVSSLNGPLSFTDADLEQQAQDCLTRFPDTGGRGGYFDAACSPLNPNNLGHGLMVYGTLPIFMVRAAADWTVQATGDTSWVGYNGAQLVGRTLSALAEMGVILVVFFIGVQLHGKWVGLLASALYACAVFSIQQSHFWTVDAISNLFVTLTIYCAVVVQTTGRRRAYIAFGIFFGAALACRINTAPLVGLLLLAAIVRALPALDGRVAWGERGRIIIRIFVGLVVAGAATILVFRVANPYAFSGPGFFGIVPNPRWLEDMGQAQYLVSGNAESPPNWQWVGRTPYLFPLANMVLWGMGIGLGLTGWLAWGVSGWRLIRGRAGALQNLLPFVWVLVYFAWLGNLWVMTMRYYLPMYPMLALLAAWALVELVKRARERAAWRRAVAWGLLVGVTGFTLLWVLMFTNIYRSMFAPAQSSNWVWENLSADFSMQVDGTDAPLMNIAVYNQPAFDDNTPLDKQASIYMEGVPFSADFRVPADGVISKVHSPHLGDPNDDDAAESVRVQISIPGTNQIVAEGTLTTDLKRDQYLLGNAYDIPLDNTLAVKAGETYTFTFQVLSGGPIISAGVVFSWEGDWDEVSLPKVCALPDGVTLKDNLAPGLVSLADCKGRDLWSSAINGYKLQIYYDEEPYKRDILQRALDNSDYLIISTNRRYDTQNRIPYRWPMTMRFYDALFDGSLGYERIQDFQETFEFGPFRVSDQYLPFYDAPAWLNEFEAEEAFHVYDHPAVMIFRKTDAYSSTQTATLLNSVPLQKIDNAPQMYNCPYLAQTTPAAFYCDPTLVGVVPLYSLSARSIPTLLQFPPDLFKIQTEGGTWSERFHSASPINTEPLVSIAAWWLTIMAFGWAAWPLLFTIFPRLADRGYSLAKIVGLVVVSWMAWFAASARLPVWSQNGIALGLVILLALGVFLLRRERGGFRAHIRTHWRQMLTIELITVLAFLGFLIVRLTNPDLWHPSFGGEKPMDFAYFNGVLRSTVFPPVDPWHSGGFINYYYYGYVVVGGPVLLIGMMPSIAYNLIIPTLFALTGMGAFAVAFNLVSRRLPAPAAPAGEPAAAAPPSDDENGTWTPPTPQPLPRLGNPWVAGVAALLLAVVLGNLDTPRVFVSEGLLRTGYYQQSAVLQNQYVQEYTVKNGAPPAGDDFNDIIAQAIRDSESPLQSVWRGLQRVLSGAPLDLAPNRWYWAPTRIISESPDGGGNAIAEFPFFTFLYGDLHAHMIAMPMLFLVMAFVLHEVLAAGDDPRRRLPLVLALALGGLTVGLLRPTNTWDWITFMLLGVLGLAFAWWLSFRRVSRAALVALVGRVGGFVGFSVLFTIPFITWYASTYNRALQWTGPYTQLWMYFTIHGLFLFLLVSLLAWDSARWLRVTRVAALRGKGIPLIAFGIFVVAILVGALLMAFSIPVTLIALPVLLWVALLFFRSGQTREMQVVLALAGLALGLTLGVEYVVLDGDIGRQNTVFKFYIQAWLLFSAAGGVAASWLLRSSSNWRGGLRVAWYSVLATLVIAGALYPLMASKGRAQDRMSPNAPLTLADIPLTLDGMAYMQYAFQYEGDPNLLQADPSLAPFPMADDYALVRWMQENIKGTPIIMEGRADREYRWESRIAILTGLPSVNGWNFHQRQQRTFDPLPRLVQQRVANINAFYSTLDIPAAWAILQHYDVSYVVVSRLEMAYYSVSGLSKFDDMVQQGMLKVAYQGGAATLYEVIKDAEFQMNEDSAGGI